MLWWFVLAGIWFFNRLLALESVKSVFNLNRLSGYAAVPSSALCLPRAGGIYNVIMVMLFVIADMTCI